MPNSSYTDSRSAIVLRTKETSCFYCMREQKNQSQALLQVESKHYSFLNQALFTFRSFLFYKLQTIRFLIHAKFCKSKISSMSNCASTVNITTAIPVIRYFLTTLCMRPQRRLLTSPSSFMQA